MSGILYVVGTPIGNLGDLTERARETLASVGLVAAEDTRRTGRLLQGLGIKVRMLSVHDANEDSRAGRVVSALHEGVDVALVTDGGMPLVSDPGFRVVRAAAAAGIDVRVVPGPSAVTAALAVSGLPTDRWAFEGFLSKRQSERRRRLEAVRDDPRTLVLFESPLRIVALLEDVAAVLGERPVAVCRELTKLHEEVLRGSVSEVAARVGTPKGEVVVVLGGAPEGGPGVPMDELVAEAMALIEAGERKRDAAKAVAARHGVAANALYRSLVGDGP